MVHRFKNSHQDGVVAADKRVFLIYKTGFRVRGKKSCSDKVNLSIGGSTISTGFSGLFT